MRRSTLLGLPLPVISALITSCSGGSQSPTPASPGMTEVAVRGGVQQITIHATDDFRFTPSTIRAHTGTLRITLVDDGSYPHNLSLPLLHSTSPTVSGNTGQRTTTYTVTFRRPGSYRFECTFHSTAGMLGTLIVTSAR